MKSFKLQLSIGLLVALISLDVLAQSIDYPTAIDFKRVEDSIAIRLLKYRHEKGLSLQCYKSEYNYVIREWAQDFIERRNPFLIFTLDDRFVECPHYQFFKRSLESDSLGKTNFNKVQEIVLFNSIQGRDKFNENRYKSIILGFDDSPKHKEVMVSEVFNCFSVGFYYNSFSRSYSCYIVFFTEKDAIKKGLL